MRLLRSMNKYCVIAIICLPLLGCSHLPEASFDLAKTSRLPKWFTLPHGVARSDVTVQLDYFPQGRVRVRLLDAAKNKTYAEVKGTLRDSAPLKLKDQRPEFPPGYPLYEVVTANGITEIIEHRAMEPVFYITDDPS